MFKTLMVFYLLFLFPQIAFTYTYDKSGYEYSEDVQTDLKNSESASFDDQESFAASKDEYREDLLRKYPEYADVVDQLYPKYSGWVISLSERFGFPPLLAMSQVPEEEYHTLFFKPEIFIDLYNELKSVGDEKKRALLALRLGNAFAVDPDKIEYKARLQKFLDATKKNRRKVEARFISEFNANHAYLNVLDVLRDDRVRYNTFLEMLAESSLEVYEAIIRYPNAAGFLLEHGMDSIEYINKTAGEIVVLSMLLPVEEQDAMMALFKRYEWMTDVLNECGAESYFAVSICPELFIRISKNLTGPMNERYFTAYSIIAHQIENAAENDTMAEFTGFLNSLSLEEVSRLAQSVGNVIEGSVDSEGEILTLSPFADPYFFKLLYKYGEPAEEVCSMYYGNFINIGTLVVRDWDGWDKDASYVLDAIIKYKEAGLMAADHFRFNRHVQNVILGKISRARDLLMFLFYSDTSGNTYNFPDWSDRSDYLLKKFDPEPFTGYPIDKEKLAFIEFMPGHDLVTVIYDCVKKGKTPTVSDMAFFVWDVYEISMIILSFGTSKAITEPIKQGVKQGVKRSAKGLSKGLIQEFGEQSAKSFGRFYRRALNIATKIPSGVRYAISKIFMFRGDRTAGNLLKSGVRYFRAVPKTSLSLFEKGVLALKELPKMYLLSSGNPNVILREMVIEPVVFYYGFNSILGFIEKRQSGH